MRQRFHPLSQSEFSRAEVAQTRDQIPIFHDPFTALTNGTTGDGLTSEMQILRPCDIHPVITDKQSERRTNTWIDVQQLIETVSRVVAIAHVDNSLVTGRF